MSIYNNVIGSCLRELVRIVSDWDFGLSDTSRVMYCSVFFLCFINITSQRRLQPFLAE